MVMTEDKLREISPEVSLEQRLAKSGADGGKETVVHLINISAA